MTRNAEISLSGELVSRLDKRASESNFESVDSYVEFVLEEVLHQLDESPDVADRSEVEDRLQSLGYVE